jgi:hypothetical protein
METHGLRRVAEPGKRHGAWVWHGRQGTSEALVHRPRDGTYLPRSLPHSTLWICS